MPPLRDAGPADRLLQEFRRWLARWSYRPERRYMRGSA